jgi:hypothetical protein
VQSLISLCLLMCFFYIFISGAVAQQLPPSPPSVAPLQCSDISLVMYVVSYHSAACRFFGPGSSVWYAMGTMYSDTGVNSHPVYTDQPIQRNTAYICHCAEQHLSHLHQTLPAASSIQFYHKFLSYKTCRKGYAVLHTQNNDLGIRFWWPAT